MWIDASVKDQSGSSLVEVTVAMVVLALAIIPMVGMMEAGLRAAASGGEYDAARTLANERLEELRALPYNEPGGPSDSVVERYAPPGPPDDAEGDLTCSVRTAFVDGDLSEATGPTGRMRVEVMVRWDDGSYSTSGIVSGEPP